jgi:hypothetical protein
MSAPKVCMSPEELAVWRRLNRMLVQMRLEQQEYAYPVVISEPIKDATPSPDDIDTEEFEPVEADDANA